MKPYYTKAKILSDGEFIVLLAGHQSIQVNSSECDKIIKPDEKYMGDFFFTEAYREGANNYWASHPVWLRCWKGEQLQL